MTRSRGFFHWTGKRPETVAGERAGIINGQGYVRLLRAQGHRLAWIFMHGPIADGLQVDHVNGIRSDNRLDNLRLVRSADNQRNMRRPSRNTSGQVGVSFNSRLQRWIAIIKVDYHTHYLGSYKEIGDAIKVRKEAEVKFGFHPNHGR